MCVHTEPCEFSERIGNNGAEDRERKRKREEGRKTAENNAADESHWQRIGYSISRVKAHRAIGSGKTGVEITRERGPIRF